MKKNLQLVYIVSVDEIQLIKEKKERKRKRKENVVNQEKERMNK